MDDAGPFNREDNNSYSSHSESTDNDYMDGTDDETIPQFISNPIDPQSHATNMAGILHLLTLV